MRKPSVVQQLLATLICIPCMLCAQPVKKTKGDQGYVSPSVVGRSPTKGLELRYEAVPMPYLQTYQERDSYKGELEEYRRFQAKAKVPLLLRPGIKLALGLDYRREHYEFEASGTPEVPFFRELSAKPLESLDVSLSGLIASRAHHFWLFRVSANLSGDFAEGRAPLHRFLRLSGAGLLGWKLSDHRSWGVGLQYNYRPGRQLLIPVLMYTQTFNRHWGVEALLPVHARLRYNASDKLRLYGGVEFKRARYGVFFYEMNDKLLELSWTEVRLGLNVERELHDWLWLEAGGGLRSSLGLDLSEAPAPNRRLLHAPSCLTPYAKVGIFLVPPRKWRK